MNNFPLIGLGIATKGSSGNTLDTFYPFLIVDDVMTTGTTVSECAGILRSAGDGVSAEWSRIVGLSVLRG